MKKELSTLRKGFGERIIALEKLLKLAKQEELLSGQREVFTSSIAVMLRALFCRDRTGTPLIVRAQLNNDFIFPLRAPLEAYNELRETMLVSYQIKAEKCCFFSDSLSPDKVPTNYLSFFSWINEVVVDFKKDGFPPLSREKVIKTIADKKGAHFDDSLEKYSACLESKGVVFLNINIDGKECLFDGRNLLDETILSIAEEVVFSYTYLRRPDLTFPLPSKSVLSIFDYSNNDKNEYHGYKYSICLPSINKYNTNHYYPCKITTSPYTTYMLKFRERAFRVGIIKAEDVIDRVN